LHFTLGANIHLWRNLSFNQQFGVGYSLAHSQAISGNHNYLFQDKVFLWGFNWDIVLGAKPINAPRFSIFKELKSPATPQPLVDGFSRSFISARVGVAPLSFLNAEGFLTGVFYHYRLTRRTSLYAGLDAFQSSINLNLDSPMGRFGCQYQVRLFKGLSYYLDAGIGAGRKVYLGDTYWGFKFDWGNMLRLNPDGKFFGDAGFHHSFNYITSPNVSGSFPLVRLEAGLGVNFGKVKPQN
jgi:hypothetical protein